MARPGRSRVSSMTGMGGVLRYSAVVLGAGGVGKSALVMRYGKNVFLEQYDPTIEEEYDLTVEYEGKRSRLEIVDTAGVEQFTGINESYIQRGMGFVLVFSLTQEASLRDVDHIRQQIYRIKGGEEDVPIVVVGTKMDLTGEREVSSQQMKELAVEWGLPFYETSAKKGWHVNEVFNHLLARMRKRYPDGMPKGHRHRRKDGQCVIM
ncbi:ras-domain-containing protein [Lentinus tigrinus ALCF2SS1-7]|uniref:Ras-domain-containing protein n=1 Tax=Lentinus tigrinus ALCF2SS1-6 TaxID=1328759 RepID=A0A5C2RSL7_9APHY|nr:ras-domain-containing protein [Lentinus tigrinus ALCF2SS1-6]RPD69301.1 ras-domain-containing protein [Lentinus tigrinus ALCF2SS1-7]